MCRALNTALSTCTHSAGSRTRRTLHKLIPGSPGQHGVQALHFLSRGTPCCHRVRELLKLIELEELGGRYPRQLSGGQMQRVAVARALASNPRRAALQGVQTRRAAAAMRAAPVPSANPSAAGPAVGIPLQWL